MSERILPLPSTSALDPATQAFPSLTPAQIDRLRAYGKLRPVAAGDVLFDVGDSSIPMFVVFSGKMEIVQPDGKGERVLATHDATGEFTGETNMISGRRSLARGRVTEAGEFLEISPENLRSVIAKDAELSEIFMRAFILRRLVLITKGFGDVILLGSRFLSGAVAAGD